MSRIVYLCIIFQNFAGGGMSLILIAKAHALYEPSVSKHTAIKIKASKLLPTLLFKILLSVIFSHN